MYMGRHKTDVETPVDDARPYVYEIINNLIAVHAEVCHFHYKHNHLNILSNLIKILHKIWYVEIYRQNLSEQRYIYLVPKISARWH